MSWVDIRVLWGREVTQFVRRPTHIASLLIGPLIWLFVFGFGIRRGLGVSVAGFDYVHYILPGILGMIVINSSARGGMSILRDRDYGFLREVLVAPVSRFSILLGTAFGRVTRSGIQALLIVMVGVLFLGVNLGGGNAWAGLALGLAFLVMIATALVSLAIAIAWYMDDVQTYSAVSTWFTFPLALLSGGVYPVQNLPAWLALPIKLNPITYGIDAMRWAILGPEAATFHIGLSLVVLTSFLVMSVALGSVVMRRVA